MGFPAGHSMSPTLFREAYSGRYPYEIIETPSFEEAWNIFMQDEWKAVNVTAPFKIQAALRAEFRSELVSRTGAANILLKTPRGIEAYNSDVLGVMNILSGLKDVRSAAVIGTGGAGRAAMQAALSSGLEIRLFHHDELDRVPGVDLIIYTLPCAVPGIDSLGCRYIIEANYRDPAFDSDRLSQRGIRYIPGMEWLREQAAAGFPIMTGERL